LSQLFLDGLQGCVDGEVLPHRETLEDCVELWAVANFLSGDREAFWSRDVLAVDVDGSLAREYLAGHCLEASGFSCAGDTKQGEAFTILESKGRLLDCSDASIRLSEVGYSYLELFRGFIRNSLLLSLDVRISRTDLI